MSSKKPRRASDEAFKKLFCGLFIAVLPGVSLASVGGVLGSMLFVRYGRVGVVAGLLVVAGAAVLESFRVLLSGFLVVVGSLGEHERELLGALTLE